MKNLTIGANLRPLWKFMYSLLNQLLKSEEFGNFTPTRILDSWLNNDNVFIFQDSSQPI